jgi:hypothetical protein
VRGVYNAFIDICYEGAVFFVDASVLSVLTVSPTEEEIIIRRIRVNIFLKRQQNSTTLIDTPSIPHSRLGWGDASPVEWRQPEREAVPAECPSTGVPATHPPHPLTRRAAHIHNPSQHIYRFLFYISRSYLYISVYTSQIIK